MLYEQLAEANMGKRNFKQAENYFNLSYAWNFGAGKYLESAQTLTNEAYSLYYKAYKNFPRAISGFKRALGILRLEMFRLKLKHWKHLIYVEVSQTFLWNRHSMIRRLNILHMHLIK